jgi:hypothetical protein
MAYETSKEDAHQASHCSQMTRNYIWSFFVFMKNQSLPAKREFMLLLSIVRSRIFLKKLKNKEGSVLGGFVITENFFIIALMKS